MEKLTNKLIIALISGAIVGVAATFFVEPYIVKPVIGVIESNKNKGINK